MKLFIKKSSLLFAAGCVAGSVTTGFSTSILGSSIFNDVEKNSYYDSAVGELYNLGIIKGYDSNTFGPDDYVTRGQVAVMFQRFRAEMLGIDLSSGSSRSSSSRSSSSSSSSTESSQRSNVHGFFRFTTDSFSIIESASSITISIIRSGGDDGSASVKYEVEGISATGSEDFTAASGTVSFGDGVTSKNITITLKDDNAGEGSETFRVKLSAPSGGASLGSPNEATVTIVDNEQSNSTNSSSSSSSNSTSGGSTSSDKTISLNASGYGVLEDAGTLTVTVSRAGSTSAAAQVQYTTANGTGKSGSEYSATSGTLSFASGETSKTFTVDITDDNSTDGAKNFTITLSNPSGGTLGTSAATVTIYDDDSNISFGSGAFKFANDEYEVDRETGLIDITVQRVSGTQGSVSVQYATRSNTASPGLDYTNTSGTLTFSAGEAAKIIRVPLIKNGTGNNESFYIDLNNQSVHTSIITPSTTEVILY